MTAFPRKTGRTYPPQFRIRERSATGTRSCPARNIHAVVLAAAAFGGVMAAVLSSDTVSGLLLSIIQKALSF